MTSENLVKDFKEALGKRFDVKDLGMLHFFPWDEGCPG